MSLAPHKCNLFFMDFVKESNICIREGSSTVISNQEICFSTPRILLKLGTLDWPPNYSLPTNGSAQSAALPTTSHLKFSRGKAITLKQISGQSVLLSTLSTLQFLPSKQNKHSPLIKKLKNVITLSRSIMTLLQKLSISSKRFQFPIHTKDPQLRKLWIVLL